MSELAQLRGDAGVVVDSALRCSSCGIGLWHWASRPEDRPAGSVKCIAGQCYMCRRRGGRLNVPRRLRFPTVVRLRAMGRSNAEIANLLGVTRRTVERWVSELRSEGAIS